MTTDKKKGGKGKKRKRDDDDDDSGDDTRKKKRPTKHKPKDTPEDRVNREMEKVRTSSGVLAYAWICSH